MKINRNEFITSFSFILDFLERGTIENISNHSKRVCLISIQIGEIIGLDICSLFDLYAYAIFHDIGIIACKTNNVFSINKNRCFEISHCIEGEKYLADFPFIKTRENIIKYHHEHYDGSGPFGIVGSNIPIFSQIISIAHSIANYFQAKIDKSNIVSKIKKYKGIKYSYVVCEAFFLLEKNISFWLSLEDMFIGNELKKYIPLHNIDLQLSELIPITEILSRISDMKSHFTNTHSIDLSQNVALMSDYYSFNDRTKTKLVIAAQLHDIGKIAIPTIILNKRDNLTEKEYYIFKSHVFYTRKALESIKGFEDITEWASNHHEKLNGTGYPYGLSQSELSFESQLIACLNLYQSLIEYSSQYTECFYTKSKKNIVDILKNTNELNKEIIADIIEYLIPYSMS